MSNYQKPNPKIWKGRISNNKLYIHEKIQCLNIENRTSFNFSKRTVSLLGYACDEGVLRNHGRIGAAKGPEAIRKMMATLSNHFTDQLDILDVGDIICLENDLENTHQTTSNYIATLLRNNFFPIVLGGGHDLAYAHYKGIKKIFPNKTIGIINLDAHFDLRKVVDKATSGTPFYQIAKENNEIKYLCLGIQKESNNRELYETANTLNVQYIENTMFTLDNKANIISLISDFTSSVDYVYLTIDMDGFSSNNAPGVSAPSPFGFSIDIATEMIRWICSSNKLLSVDLVELNPLYDIDNCTSRLAARLIYKIIDWTQNQ